MPRLFATEGLAERPASVRADQPQRQEWAGLGEAGRAAPERGRGGFPPDRLLRAGRQPLPAHRHVPAEPDVRHIVPDGVRTDPRLPLVPPPVRTVGHHHRRSDEGPGPVPGRAQHLRVRVFHADRRHEPSGRQETGEETKGRVFRR